MIKVNRNIEHDETKSFQEYDYERNYLEEKIENEEYHEEGINSDLNQIKSNIEIFEDANCHIDEAS